MQKKDYNNICLIYVYYSFVLKTFFFKEKILKMKNEKKTCNIIMLNRKIIHFF